MCRMLLSSKRGIIEYDKKYSVLKLLDHLVKELGGDGNGIVLIKDKIIKFYKRGVSLSILDCYNYMINMEYNYIIFHTRLASIGSISDKNCHPFVYKNSCLAMNGTIHEFKFQDDKTDTEMLFEIVKKKPMNDVIKKLKEFDSSFIGCVNGNPFAIRNINSLMRWGGLIVSSFPKEVLDIHEFGYGEVWKGG